MKKQKILFGILAFVLIANFIIPNIVLATDELIDEVETVQEEVVTEEETTESEKDESIVDEYIKDDYCGWIGSQRFFNNLTSGMNEMGKKKNIKHGDFFAVANKTKKINGFVYDFEKKNGFETVDLFEAENKAYVENNETGDAHASLRKNSRMKNILPLYYNKSGYLKCISLFKLTTPKPIALKDTSVFVGGNHYQPKFIASKKKSKKSHFGIYSFSIPMADVVNLPATNMVALNYKDDYGFLVQCHIVYLSPLKNTFVGLRGQMCIDKETSTVAIFRQSTKNRLNVYVRSVNVTDKIKERMKQYLAYLVSLVWVSKKAKKIKINQKYLLTGGMFDAIMCKVFCFTHYRGTECLKKTCGCGRKRNVFD